jgi:hypothetical protein
VVAPLAATRALAATRRRLGRVSTAVALPIVLIGGLTAVYPAGHAMAADSASRTRASAAAATRPAVLLPGARAACDAGEGPGIMHCLVLVRTNIPPLRKATAAQTPFGFGPSSLQSAYKLPSSSAGAGQTVAVVDSFDDPNAATDLATYRSQYGLAPCTTVSGCFTKVNQNGQASPLPAAAGSTGWATEESLDLDMVSAICPNCRILLVEANSANISDLGTGVNSAVTLGARFVSNSYGGSEYSSETSDESSYYNHPGVAITASSGDSGYGVSFPAVSRYVTSVGGTSLASASNSRGWTETTWNGTGAGCSGYEPKPTWQTDTGCSKRTDNDVSAVADPNTGVATYDSYDGGGWVEVGGTSASSPIIAGVYALAGTPASASYPASFPYLHTSSLNDVTTSGDGSCVPAYLCTAQAGYDGPTGLGTPAGVAAFTSNTPVGNTVTVFSPGNRATTIGTAASLQIQASDSGSGQTLSYSATGLPAGLSISSSSGLISGTPTTAGNFSVTVTGTDTTGASGSASFSWVVNPPVGPIKSGLAGKCADDFRNSSVNSNIIDIWTCNGGAAQNWTVGSDGTLRINSKCMDITGASTSNGAKIQLWACSGGANQVWQAGINGRLVNPHSGKCLDDTGSSTVDGTQLQIWTCNGGTNQKWTLP